LRIVQRPEHSHQFFLLAETDADRIFVAALRQSGRQALDVHTILPDDIYDEFVRNPATLRAVIDGESREFRCMDCNFGRDRAHHKVCDRHRHEYEREALQEVVEVEMLVPCTCMLAEEGDHGFNNQTGHMYGCLRAKAIGAQIVTPDDRWKIAQRRLAEAVDE
jgi:hypothetical protein